MTTKQLIETYLNKVKEKSDWQTLIADNIRFESPSQTSVGRDEYIVAASRFFQMVNTLEVKHLVVDEDEACAWVDYNLSRNGKTFTCKVCELLKVQNDSIVLSAILFDTFALKAFTSAN